MTVRTVVHEAELEACLGIRRCVFIEELGVPESDELDSLDSDCTHFLAWAESNPDFGNLAYHAA